MERSDIRIDRSDYCRERPSDQYPARRLAANASWREGRRTMNADIASLHPPYGAKA